MSHNVGRHRAAGRYNPVSELGQIVGQAGTPLAKGSAVIAASGGLIAAIAIPAQAADSTAEVDAALASMRWQPAIRTLPPYHDDPAYIAALQASVETGLAALDFTPDVLLASFHGMPERTLKLGDPYHCECHKTARLLAERATAASRSASEISPCS